MTPTADRRLSSPDSVEKPPGANDYGEQTTSGVDLSLVRYMLSLSPLERLRVMERHARDTLLLMEYGRRAHETTTSGHR